MKGMNLTKSGKVGLGMPKRRVAGDVGVKVRKPRKRPAIGVGVKVRNSRPRPVGTVRKPRPQRGWWLGRS